MKRTGPSEKRAKRIIQEHGGMIQTGEALKAGIHARSLYSLRDSGELEQVSRGVFRLVNLRPISNPDLVTVASRVQKGVICLVSALSFHELTTQVPHKVYIALEKGAEEPRIDFPPLSTHRFSKAAFNAGILEQRIDEVLVRVYNPEKTLADCFKFRNKLGMEVVLEAIKLYKSRKRIRIDELLAYARICRVERAIRPYLEAIL